MDYKLPFSNSPTTLNRIQRILIWLSGAEESCLAKCPKWERRKYEAFGASVLVPVSFGMIGSSYAISTLTDNLFIVIGFAMVWGFIILTIDRVLLATYRAFTTKSKKVIQFVLRMSVAILMGLTVSHPLTLLLFKDTITSEIEKKRVHEMAEIRAESDIEKRSLEDRITKTAEGLAQLQQKYEDTVSGDFVTSQISASDSHPSTPAGDAHFSDIDFQIKELKEERHQVQSDLEEWQATYDSEVSGERGGKPGIGPRARAIEADQLAWRRDEITRLSRLIADQSARRTHLSAKLMEDRASANAEIASRKRELEKQKLDLFASQQGQLVALITEQITSNAAELDRLRDDAKQLSIDTRDRVAGLKTERRADMMTQTIILHEIFENPENGGHFAMIVYLVIAALFTLIDTLPLVVKFFSVAGPYDMLQHIEGSKYSPLHKMEIEEDSENFDRQNQIFRKQMQARIDMFRDINSYWGSNVPILPEEGTTESVADIASLVKETEVECVDTGSDITGVFEPDIRVIGSRGEGNKSDTTNGGDIMINPVAAQLALQPDDNIPNQSQPKVSEKAASPPVKPKESKVEARVPDPDSPNGVIPPTVRLALDFNQSPGGADHESKPDPKLEQPNKEKIRQHHSEPIQRTVLSRHPRVSKRPSRSQKTVPGNISQS